MAAVDRLNYKKVQRSYYNVNMYNDTDEIAPAKFAISTTVPLLHSPEQYEVAVCRCSVPLDGIPISQRDIPYGEWAIMVRDGHADPPNSNVAVVAQFATQTIITPVITPNYFTITNYLSTYQTGNIDLQTNNLVLNTAISLPVPIDGHQLNFTYPTSNFIYSHSSSQERSYLTTLSTGASTNSYLTLPTNALSMCADNLGRMYFLGNPPNLDNCNLAIFQYNYGSPYHQSSITLTGYGLQQTMNNITINNFEAYTTTTGETYINLGVNYSIGNPPAGDVPNFAFQVKMGANGILDPSSLIIPYTSLNIDTNRPVSIFAYSDTQYYTSFYVNNGWFLVGIYNLGSSGTSGSIQYPPESPVIGTGITKICAVLDAGKFILKVSDIVYLGILNLNSVLTTTPITGITNIMTLSNMYTNTTNTSTIIPNGLYPIWTIQDYVNKFNTALFSAFTAVFPLGSPEQPTRPYLSYSNAKFSMNVPIVFTAGSDYTISFNTRLGRRFLFNTMPDEVFTGVNPITTLTENFYPLQLLPENPNEENPTSLIYNIPQPNSTAYKFFDITRIIIGSTKLSVAGDTELSNTSLLNITDFAVDTTSPNVLLQIYEPTILRYYQMYQTSPLTMLDAFLQYATKDGNIYNINLIPGESASMKLLFRRSNLQITKF
jgi:hypothetical protein